MRYTVVKGGVVGKQISYMTSNILIDPCNVCARVYVRYNSLVKMYF